MSDDIGQFFDRQKADYYDARYRGMGAPNRSIASRIESLVEGRILCVGGLWAEPSVDPRAAGMDITVVDVSEEMVAKWKAEGYQAQKADARALPFEDASFDTVVFPLILHHIAGANGRTARAGIREAVAEAARVLRPGGQVIVSDFSVGRAVYAAELALAPLTRRVLSLADIPLVVMHTARFFERSLRQASFRDVKLEHARDRGRPWDIIQPVIGLRWLLVPRAAYPIESILMTARTHASA